MNDQLDPHTRRRRDAPAHRRRGDGAFLGEGLPVHERGRPAAAGGVHSGSLYHYFPGKQDVLIAVLDMYLTGIDEMLLEAVWKSVPDPIDRVFALLAKYRQLILSTDCTYGCPIGSLALELHEPDPPVRKRLAANFKAWTDAIEGCLRAAGSRIPREVDRAALATFVLTTMEGGVMLARTYRDVAPFDAAVAELRIYFDHLLAEEAPRRKPRKSR
jgi:AcrR family transcriptional regulator